MGRSVVYDSVVKAQLEKIFEAKENFIGLIVGQRIPQRDVVIYLCPTPIQDEDKDDDNDEEEGQKFRKGNVPAASQVADRSIFQLDEAWTTQHAKEVTRMLPGGFDVLGLFVAAPTDLANKFQSDIRQILYTVITSLAKDRSWSIHPNIPEGILLHICTVSHKYICRTYDITNEKSTPNPAEWKPLSTQMKWHTLKSEMAGDLKFPISRENRSLSIKRQLELAMSPLFQKISVSVALIDGALKDPEESLAIPSDGKKSKLKAVPAEHVVDLLSPLKSKSCPVHSQTSECVLMFTCKGTMHCRAFVHAKATVEEAVKAVHQDIVRSIMARCAIHCEDLLLIDEEQQDPVVVYELPRRVFAPLADSGLLVCDYQFHSDTAGDSIMSFKELLNLDLSEDDIQAFESSPTTRSLIQPNNIKDDRLAEFGDDNAFTPQNVLFPAVGAAIIAIVFGIIYIILLRHT